MLTSRSQNRCHPAGIRLGIVRGISDGPFGPPHEFIAPSRELGAGLVRLYVHWGQVQPAPDRWDWTFVDSFLVQLTGAEEVWVTVCSISPWATRCATEIAAPSPAKENETFHAFVRALVSRCAGRVQYWQCNHEPSDAELMWDGSASDYVAQLAVFHGAVRDADPGAAVVLGGCGYDVVSGGPDSPARRFFEQVVAEAGDYFDLFSVHLCDEPARTPAQIHAVREMMRAHGYERPVVVGEYDGPRLPHRPDAGGAHPDAHGGPETPQRRALKARHADVDGLAPRTQMLTVLSPRELQQRGHCRALVSRNLFILSTGARRTVCWHLARGTPAARTFRLLATHLDGAESVTRTHLDGQPRVRAFCIERPERGQVVVLWRDGPVLPGEDEPHTPIRWPWDHDAALLVDAFGVARQVVVRDGQVQVPVSIIPVFISPLAAV